MQLELQLEPEPELHFASLWAALICANYCAVPLIYPQRHKCETALVALGDLTFAAGGFLERQD
jgi:hypothetical protein